MTFFSGIHYADTSNLDAFGRLRVAAPLTLFDSKQIFDKQPQFWDELLELGAGIASVHSVNTASSVITSTLNQAGIFTRQTFMRFNYQPGKSQQIYMTGVLARSGGPAGVVRRIGMFDDDNGLFFEDDEGTVKVVRRTNVTGTPVDNKVAQASWNLDPMDGTGPSGVTIDWSKVQIFSLDFAWLGASRTRMALVLDGRVVPVHEFLVANVLDKVFMSTPNLPLRYQMKILAAIPAASMEAICATVISEGGRSELGSVRRAGSSGVHIDANIENTLYAIVGIRLKATHLGAEVQPVDISIAEHQGNKSIEWVLLFNGTITGSPLWTGQTNSAVEVMHGAAAHTMSGGVEFAGEYFQSVVKGGVGGAALRGAIRLGAKIDGTVDELILCARPVGGSINADIEGSITWRETP